jgi:hypothetical protein
MNIWLINTIDENRNPNAYKQMFKKNRASAFYSNYKTENKISTQDIILLCHNQNDIVAVGFVINDEEQSPGYIENFVSVDWFWKASFNNEFEPTNPINKNTLGITKNFPSVIKVTNDVNCRILLEEIAKRQDFF